MDFHIANTFSDDLSRLSSREQKSVNPTVFDIQIDPANPEMRLHKVDMEKSNIFCSLRVRGDILSLLARPKCGCIPMKIIEQFGEAVRKGFQA